jgi:hypothetical protein
MVSAETQTRRFSERTIRQVNLDCKRAMIRGRFCPDRSEVAQQRCVADQHERDEHFGSQLWYFEGWGVDLYDQGHAVFGVVEYSLQYGLHELVEDAVFESDDQRERFRQMYDQERVKATWDHPLHRWLALGVVLMAVFSLTYLMIVTLT